MLAVLKYGCASPAPLEPLAPLTRRFLLFFDRDLLCCFVRVPLRVSFHVAALAFRFAFSLSFAFLAFRFA
jgi:hypothetical protein